MENVIKIDDINEITLIPQEKFLGKVYVLSQTLFCDHEGNLSTRLAKPENPESQSLLRSSNF